MPQRRLLEFRPHPGERTRFSIGGYDKQESPASSAQRKFYGKGMNIQ